MRELLENVGMIGCIIILIIAVVALGVKDFSQNKEQVDVVECTVVPHGDGTISLVRSDTGDQYFYENDEGREYPERIQVVFDNRYTKDVTDDYIVGFIFD